MEMKISSLISIMTRESQFMADAELACMEYFGISVADIQMINVRLFHWL